MQSDDRQLNTNSPARTTIKRSSRLLTIALGVSLSIAAPIVMPHSPLGQAGVAAAATTTTGLWNGDPIPAVANVDDHAGVEVGTRFKTDANGFITGVRFYKGRTNTGVHVAQLWDTTGRSLAKATFTAETASGWQTASFGQPVRVYAGRSYTASYYANEGHYAFTMDGFAQPLRNGPLTTPQGAGVYRYGPSGFPTASYQRSNYWVDVRFTTTAPTTSAPVSPVAPTASPMPTVAPVPTATAVPTSPAVAPSPTTTPVRTEAPAPVTLPTAAPAPGTRSRYSWPFSATSIWNMPIGSAAAYRPLGMTPPTTAYGTDEVYIALNPSAPLRPLVDRGYWWPWNSGSSVTGSNTGVSVRVPDNWIVPPPSMSDYPNRASAALQADGTVREWQYTARPTAGSPISMFEAPRANYSLTGDGLQGNQFGSHGGSGMIGLGGTIRNGELSGAAPIRHALALTMNMRKWGTKQGGNITNGFRWPATAADSYYDQYGSASGYGTITSGGGQPKDGLGMGSLLAIPASVDLSGLGFETAAGAKLAWTHQNYGAYVVDDSQDPGSWDVHRLNVEIDVLDEVPAIDTYPGTNTAFGRDMNKIFSRLAVVDNNSPATIGGGGSPRQPLAPTMGS